MNDQPTIEIDTDEMGADTSEMSDAERRASPRVELCVPVEVGSVTSFRGTSADFSAGGMRVKLDDVLPVGSLVDLNFSVPGVHRRFEVLGEIRWVRESAQSSSGHGVEFLNLPDEGGRALREVLETYDSVSRAIFEAADDLNGVVAL
ncbi:MAG: PilZ domain-containing protein [Persicimonas sp.]